MSSSRMTLRGPRVILALGFASMAALASSASPPASGGSSAAAPPKTGEENPLGIPNKVRDKLMLFLERYSRVAPDRKLELEPEWRAAPPGFIVLRRRLTSSEEKFNENAPVLLTQDQTQVFFGQVMKLDDGAGGDFLGPEGPRLVSKLLTEKAGDPIDVTWGGKRGPAGTFPGKMLQGSEAGKIEVDSYLSADGKWFMLGAFYQIGSDPRQDRMKRLNLTGLPSTGPEKASVVVVEFTDYQCPSCRERQSDIEAAMQKYRGKVRLVHMDHPIWRMHDWAVTAAEGSRCVEKIAGVDAYWKYKKAVYERQKEIKADNFEELMKPVLEVLGVSFESWNECRKSGTTKPLIAKDLSQGFGLGVQGTPTLLVNGKLIDYGVDKVLDRTIAETLAGK